MSDSEVENIKDWTLVGHQGDIESDNSSSGSSSDFVHLAKDQVVSFHHKNRHKLSGDSDGAVEDIVEDLRPAQFEDATLNVVGPQIAPNDVTHSTQDVAGISEPSADDPVDVKSVGLACDQDVLGEQSPDPESILDDKTDDEVDEHGAASSADSSGPEFLDKAVVCALTASSQGHTPDESSSGEGCAAGGRTQVESELHHVDSPEPGTVNSASTAEGSESDVASLEHVEDLPSSTMATSGGGYPEELSNKEEANLSGESSSEIEELEMPEEEEIDLYEQGIQQVQPPVLPSSDLLRLQAANRRRSGSESDMSDIVKLDLKSAEDAHPFPRRRRTYTPASDLMQASASSGSSAGSSFSSRFHFVQPIPGNHRYVYPRGDEEDEDSLPGDVDDRCESDISGVAPDDSDPDLSSVSYNLDDLEIFEGDVVRSYRHKPNSRLNAFLTTLALLTLFITIGVGIGHYLGTMRTGMRRDQQTTRMMELQDDYLRCLRQHNILEAQASVTDQQKIAAVTAVWKEKYEELIIEKVELESSMKQLQASMSGDLGEAQRKILLQRDSIHDILEEVNQLRIENDQYRTQITEIVVNTDAPVLEGREAPEADGEDLTGQQSQLKGQTEDLELKERHLQERDSQRQGSFEEEQTKDPEQTSREDREASDEDVTITDEDEEEIAPPDSLPSVDVPEPSVAVFTTTAEVIRQTLTMADSKTTVLLLKILDDVNSLEQENHELRTQVARLRYSQRQYTAQDVDLIMKGEANRLANENEDLKWVVGKLRYSQQNPVDTPADPPEADSVVQQASHEDVTVETVEIEPTASVEQPCQQNKDRQPAPSFLSCLSLLLPDISMADLQMFSSEVLSNFTQPIITQMQFVKNVTADAKFTQTLGNKWSHLKKIVKSSQPSNLGERVDNLVQDIQSMISGRWNQYVQSESFEKVKTTTKGTISSMVDSIGNSSAVAKYQEFVNKTKESVSKLSKKIKKTWNKVKNLTGDFLRKNKAMSSFGDSVKSNLKKLGSSVESGWKKAQKKMERSGWMPGSWSKKERKKGRKSKQKQKFHRDDEINNRIVREQYSTPRSMEVVEPAGEVNLKTKHKQTKSSTADHEKYAEYWKQAEFEPDDFFQEGFFEGNNREWNKHQKRVKKLVGRFQRLNENLFMAMDDDDIEDMYDDFDDVQDDLDDSSVPGNLMTWLTCQVRWWKSRLYRKHSNEDLVKGCAQKLTQWQLKALCTPSCPQKSGRKCKKHSKAGTLNQGPFCLYYQSVILPSKSQENLGDGPNHETYQNPSRHVIVMSVDENDPTVSGTVENSYGKLRYDINMNGADGEEEEEILKYNSTLDMDLEEQSEDEGDVQWMFERAESREAHRHDGSWAFKRDRYRNFERNKPWFYKRADHRAEERARADYHEFDKNDA